MIANIARIGFQRLPKLVIAKIEQRTAPNFGNTGNHGNFGNPAMSRPHL